MLGAMAIPTVVLNAPVLLFFLGYLLAPMDQPYWAFFGYATRSFF